MGPNSCSSTSRLNTSEERKVSENLKPKWKLSSSSSFSWLWSPLASQLLSSTVAAHAQTRGCEKLWSQTSRLLILVHTADFKKSLRSWLMANLCVWTPKKSSPGLSLQPWKRGPTTPKRHPLHQPSPWQQHHKTTTCSLPAQQSIVERSSPKISEQGGERCSASWPELNPPSIWICWKLFCSFISDLLFTELLTPLSWIVWVSSLRWPVLSDNGGWNIQLLQILTGTFINMFVFC